MTPFEKKSGFCGKTIIGVTDANRFSVTLRKMDFCSLYQLEILCERV